MSLGSGLVSCSGCQTGYNTYSVIINRTNTSDESITWYLNGNAYYTVSESQVGASTWQAAVNFGSGSTQFDARVASGAAGGVSGLVEVVLDNPSNPPVGSFAVANTGGWASWETIPANISTVSGTHNVYLEFVSGAAGDPPFVSLYYFDFPVS